MTKVPMQNLPLTVVKKILGTMMWTWSNGAVVMMTKTLPKFLSVLT
jgi:hypothetical protein